MYKLDSFLNGDGWNTGDSDSLASGVGATTKHNKTSKVNDRSKHFVLGDQTTGLSTINLAVIGLTVLGAAWLLRGK